MFSKKGLSNIISVVLLVLLAIAATGIVWALISTIISSDYGDSKIRSDLSMTNFEIVSESVLIKDGNVDFVLKRKSGGTNVSGVIIVLVDSSGNRRSQDYCDSDGFEVLESRKYNFEKGDIGLPKEVVAVEVYPCIINEEGEHIISAYSVESANNGTVPSIGEEECKKGGDCSGDLDECNDWDCLNKRCVSVYSDDGASCEDGTCNGLGICVPEGFCFLFSDCTDDLDECNEWDCVDSMCESVYSDSGIECSIGICDGVGNCILDGSCEDKTDCLGEIEECEKWECAGGSCIKENLEYGFLCLGGNAVCDGEGICDTGAECIIDDHCVEDVYGSAGICKEWSCENLRCVAENSVVGIVCERGTCDGLGNCGTCEDGIKNQDEDCIDVGGACESEISEVTCNDGLDNDCDGDVDYYDEDCLIDGLMALFSCDSLDVMNGRYILADDISGIPGDCFMIEELGIELIGNDKTITGSGFGSGIKVLESGENFEVRNIIVSGFVNGISFDSVRYSYATVEDNTFSENKIGVYLRGAVNNNFVNNNIVNNEWYGVRCEWGETDNDFDNNVICGNVGGSFFCSSEVGSPDYSSGDLVSDNYFESGSSSCVWADDTHRLDCP